MLKLDSFVKFLQKHWIIHNSWLDVTRPMLSPIFLPHFWDSGPVLSKHHVRWPTQPFCWPRHVWWSQWCLGPWGGKWIGQVFWRDTRFWMITAFWRGFPKKNTLDDEKVETCKNCRHWSFLMCASLAALINDLPSTCFVCIQIHPPKIVAHEVFGYWMPCRLCGGHLQRSFSKAGIPPSPWLSWAPGKGYHSLGNQQLKNGTWFSK